MSGTTACCQLDMREISVVCFVVLVTLVLDAVAALSCYSCDKFETSEDCMNVTECGVAEICYARADGLSNGKVKYTVGCTRNMTPVREDKTFCLVTCSQNLCNLNKCNMPVSPKGKPDRSPRCLSCNLIANPTTCTNVVQCQKDEICYVREVTVYGYKKFRLGCMHKQHCSMKSSGEISPVQIVGKRAANPSNTSTACSTCCENDHCNALACQPDQQSSVGPTHGLRLLDHNGTCVDQNKDSCAVFGTLDTNACKAIPKVDVLCPKTCGLCGHFGWSQWSRWSECSQTCDEGTSQRSRSCLYQIDVAHPHSCVGKRTESKSCTERICPTEGAWTEWGSWGDCSLTCAYGTRTRSRNCNSLSHHQGGVYCSGSHLDTSLCNQQPCPPETYCPDNWVVYHLSCYFFGHSNLSFALAQTFCHARNASLVHIESRSENTFIVDNLKTYSNPTGGWWIGMTDSDVEGTWKWTDTNQRVNFTDWMTGEPSIQGSEDCGEFDQSFNYKWNDADCTLALRVICER